MDALELHIEIPLTLKNFKEAALIWQAIEQYKRVGGSASGWREFVISFLLNYLQNQGDCAYSIGQGWQLNLPCIKSSSDAVYVRLPDGSLYNVFEMKMGEGERVNMGIRTLVFEQH